MQLSTATVILHQYDLVKNNYRDLHQVYLKAEQYSLYAGFVCRCFDVWIFQLGQRKLEEIYKNLSIDQMPLDLSRRPHPPHPWWVPPLRSLQWECISWLFSSLLSLWLATFTSVKCNSLQLQLMPTSVIVFSNYCIIVDEGTLCDGLEPIHEYSILVHLGFLKRSFQNVLHLEDRWTVRHRRVQLYRSGSSRILNGARSSSNHLYSKDG